VSSNNWPENAFKSHRELLKKVEESIDPPAMLEQVEQLIEQIRRAGARTADFQERDYMQSLLTFWGNWVYNQTRVYPNTDLYPPAPETPRAPSDVLQPNREQNFNPPAPAQTVESSGVSPITIGLVIIAFALILILLLVLPGRQQEVNSFTTPTPEPAATTMIDEAGDEPSFAALGVAENAAITEPFIMVNVASPAEGQVFEAGEAITLNGVYANLRPNWRVFFVVQREGDDLSLMLVDGGYSAIVDYPTGTWEAPNSFELSGAGNYFVGVLLAITPEAMETLTESYQQQTSLDTLPEGVIPFLRLRSIRID
jgi:hypothetical protein